MVLKNPSCLGDYDFERIALFAHKRFIEGVETITLMEHAATEREKEEIALVCMLDVEDDMVRDLHLDCRYKEKCEVTNCRTVLRQLIEKQRNYVDNVSVKAQK